VEVLATEPEEPYTVIAVVESQTDALFRGFDDLRSRMVAEAAELGGQALILGPERTESSVIFTPTPIFYEQRRLSGKVIVFDPRG
jgi:hypothetical protein